jgi:hypothetical protein
MPSSATTGPRDVAYSLRSALTAITSAGFTQASVAA